MNRSIRILGTLVLISAAFSCKKDKDTSSNKTRLSKLIQWRSTNPSKGIVTTEFIYDSEKRVTEIEFYNGDSVGTEIKSAKYRSIKFFYNGKDQAPYKSVGGMSGMGNTTGDVYHFYNLNGNLTKDSAPAIQYYNLTVVRRYNYNANKIIILNETKDSWSTSTSRDSCLTADHNLTETYTFSNSFSQVSGFKLIYDNKINPLSKLNIAVTSVRYGPLGFPSVLSSGYSNNNVTEYSSGTSIMPGVFSPQSVYYFTYTYNDNNLPVECRTSDGNTNMTTKFYYIEQ